MVKNGPRVLFFASSYALAAIFLGLTLQPGDAAEWPQFRGPTAQGHAASAKLPLEWSETENVIWRTPLPGIGHSSPVIEGGMIWLTTARHGRRRFA